MNLYVKVYLILNTIWATFIVIFLQEVNSDMTWWQSLLWSVLPAALGSVTTLIATRHSQIKKNTNSIEKLIEQLGLSKDVSLFKKTSDEYETIIKDIGREKTGPLTEQHKELGKSITQSFATTEKSVIQSFAVIQKRYDNEDDKYRLFTQSQYDLKNTMENFVKDYTETLSREKNWSIKYNILLEQNEHLQKENQDLQIENQNLRIQIQGQEPYLGHDYHR